MEEIREEKLDKEFREQALQACKDIGLPEDEAELMVDDYMDGVL
jgi:hypothetical protein